MVDDTDSSYNASFCNFIIFRTNYRRSAFYLRTLLNMSVAIDSKYLSPLFKNNNFLACPKCLHILSIRQDKLKCSSCRREYGLENGIPSLFVLEKSHGTKSVTKIVKSFYEDNPFPNYEDIDSQESLRKKAAEGVFARLLDEQVHYKANILEIGCGTGQLSNFLGLTWGRRIFAADICLNSLRLGNKFRLKNKIDNVVFVQMNLFKPSFKPGRFDLVIANGVLHHTNDPYRGFKSIAKLVKKNGYIIVGLYNKYGRFTTDLRRLLFKISGPRFKFLDPRLRNTKVSDVRKKTWFLDQYENPHESKHTIDEVIVWFEKSGFEFVNSIPEILPPEENMGNSKLFTESEKGTSLDRLFTQLNLMLSGGREGGFFIMIGKRNK